ncbi:hypothetical protein, partial [Pseudomonas aeruginosa]|uniref:hypothetical protein n=1 Tax=Pseudomonas aeruginosa TaxID=287 RepID=UPI0039C1FCB6
MTDPTAPFDDHPLWHKRTRLANGAEVHLRAAARWYAALELLLGADLEWDPLPLLRECAFGRPLDRSQA